MGLQGKTSCFIAHPARGRVWNLVLQTEAPAGAIPEQALASLLKAKLDGLDAALTHMLQRPSQRVAWDRIRTDRLPDLDKTAAWAKEKVAQWR